MSNLFVCSLLFSSEGSLLLHIFVRNLSPPHTLRGTNKSCIENRKSDFKKLLTIDDFVVKTPVSYEPVSLKMRM